MKVGDSINGMKVKYVNKNNGSFYAVSENLPVRKETRGRKKEHKEVIIVEENDND